MLIHTHCDELIDTHTNLSCTRNHIQIRRKYFSQIINSQVHGKNKIQKFVYKKNDVVSYLNSNVQSGRTVAPPLPPSSVLTRILGLFGFIVPFLNVPPHNHLDV